jgi:hypothetical protein
MACRMCGHKGTPDGGLCAACRKATDKLAARAKRSGPKPKSKGGGKKGK